MRLSCQEQMLPGGTLLQKWDAALAFGFDAIELRGQGGTASASACRSCERHTARAS